MLSQSVEGTWSCSERRRNASSVATHRSPLATCLRTLDVNVTHCRAVSFTVKVTNASVWSRGVPGAGCCGLLPASFELESMSASGRLRACHGSVEQTVQARLGVPVDGADTAAHVQQALKQDPLLAALSAADATRGHAERRAKELTHQVHDAEASEQLAAVKRQLAAAEERGLELREDLKTQLTAAADARTQLEGTTQAHHRVQAQNEALEAQTRVLQAQLAAAQHAVQQMQADGRERNSDLNSARAGLESLQGQIERQRAECTYAADLLQESQLSCQDLRAQLQQAQEECQQLRRVADQAGADASACITELQGSCAHAASELASCRGDLATAQAAAQGAEAQSRELRELNRGLRADMREAEALLRRADEDRCSPRRSRTSSRRRRRPRTRSWRAGETLGRSWSRSASAARSC